MTYKLKDDITREEIQALVDALNPFYGIGSLLAVAQQEGGSAVTKLYNGEAKPAAADADDCEQEHDDLQAASCLFGAVGLQQGVAASYMAPVLQARHFFAAHDAFMACVEDAESKE